MTKLKEARTCWRRGGWARRTPRCGCASGRWRRRRRLRRGSGTRWRRWIEVGLLADLKDVMEKGNKDAVTKALQEEVGSIENRRDPTRVAREL